MGQIVLRNQDYTYCNLQAIQAGGSQANTVLDLGEVWIVDSTNASKTNGSGKYDKYIVGDGSAAAKNLTIRNIDDNSSLDIWVEDYSKQYFTTVALENGTIDFTLFSLADTTYVESFAYSKNGGEWIETQNSDNREENIVISVNVVEGDKIRWKGIANHIGDDGDNGGVFTSTCRFDAQGNIMSLLYGDDFKDKITLENEYEFSFLFRDMSNENDCLLVNALNLILPATILTECCYDNMFYGCTSLTTAPELPATTLANRCYQQMFQGCTSLTTAPELPAMTLAENCYNYMFYGCTSLTTAPALPATTLASYCYEWMFGRCTSLNSITCLTTNISATNCTSNWVQGVASAGTFIKADNANWSTGVNGIPEGWNVYTESEYEVVRHYELNESELAISAALNDLNSRTSLTEITWAELKELRDNSNLVPGKQYRITDYVATVDSYVEPYARSANHQFDIIVTADSVNKLNEQARAIQHVGDAYFANSNLEAWELKYTLDNVQWSVQFGEWIFTDDALWFTLTGTTEIDGHTYKLWYNKDFDPEDATHGYLATTSNNVNDGTSTINIDTNTIASVNYSTIEQYKSSNVDGKGTILYMKDEFNNECPYDFKNIQFKRWKATDAQSGRNGLNNLYMVANPNNTAKNLSVSNTEDYIWAYTFSSDNSGGNQTDFSLGDHSVSNNVFKSCSNELLNNVMFGSNHYYNSFGFSCHNNSWGNNCHDNSWGSSCYNNSWGNGCYYNSWGNDCGNNSWGNDCYSNSWNNNCYHNSWGNNVIFSTVFDDVVYTQITTANVKFVQVLNGIYGAESSLLTLAFAANKMYTQVACMTSAGALKIYVPGDLA